MSQTTFDLQPEPCADGSHLHPADAAGRAGFQIGWDHAHHGLVPPPELLLQGTPMLQGWMAGRAVFGHRTLTPTRLVRLWLQLRTQAWRAGLAFDELQVTPHYLGQIHAERCPVLRQPLGGASGSALAPVVERLNPQAGYAAGNLVTMSLAAARARAGLSVEDLSRRARGAELCGDDVAGLPAAAWWRLATLTALALPAGQLPFHVAARLPMAVLPPNRVRVLHAASGLQALVTRLFLSAGWAARARALAQLLPAHTLRHDFNLFAGAMAPRVLEADPARLREALEDAWLNERVQRRWQHFLLGLGEAACETLLEQAANAGLAGVRTITLQPEQATEGWELELPSRAVAHADTPAHAHAPAGPASSNNSIRARSAPAKQRAARAVASQP